MDTTCLRVEVVAKNLDTCYFSLGCGADFFRATENATSSRAVGPKFLRWHEKSYVLRYRWAHIA